MDASSWVERVTALHQWRRGGERAPHKPLLLLYVLGRWQRLGSSAVSFTEAERDLRRLLEEFGPPRATSPGYPFHHLTSDGLWVVRTPGGGGSPGPNLGALRAGAVGELDARFATALEHPALFAAVVRGLLDANFPATLHQDVLEAVGITLEAAELPELPGSPDATTKRRRDPAFRERVLVAYEYRCGVCGYDGQLAREAVGLDAAHIRWWAAQGPDELENAVALCTLHHKLLDRGAIGFTASHHVTVSSHFLGRGAVAETLVLNLVGAPLLAPHVGQARPAGAHLAWHAREVFRPPARAPESESVGGV